MTTDERPTASAGEAGAEAAPPEARLPPLGQPGSPTPRGSAQPSSAHSPWPPVVRLPDAPSIVSCNAPFGSGGLGRHLAELAEALSAAGRLHGIICAPGGAPGIRSAQRIAELAPSPSARRAIRWTPARVDPGWRVLIASGSFDRRAARRLPGEASGLLAFNGQALSQMKSARRLGFGDVGLVSANCHLAHEAECFKRAYRDYPIERPWALRNIRRNLAEYERADWIYVSSRHAWQSFAERGLPPERLRYFPLTPDRRFCPGGRTGAREHFTVVYVGSLAVHKGIGLLLDAFAALTHSDLRLVLVGGWSTRAMRRFIESRLTADSRIQVRPGDPLPQLQRADLLVHPSYGDGFAYAPAEALACGVPVLVSDQTGMKELIGGSNRGRVLPTGNLQALTEAIDAAYRGELFAAAGRGERAAGAL